MTGSWLQTLATLPPAADVMLKMTAILALGWTLHALARRRNPRWRVALWRGVAVALVAAPAIAVLLPVIRIAVAPPAPAVMVMPELKPMMMPPMPAFPLPEAAPPVLSEAPAAPSEPWLDLRALAREHPWAMLAALWAAAAAAQALPIARAWAAMRRILRHSSPAPQPACELRDELATRLNCRPGVALRISAAAPAPFLCGALRPTIVLPEAMTGPDYREELPAILAHELAHTRSRDVLWGLALHALRIALWFHPLAWGMRAAHAAACEEVCDAVAAGAVGDALSYSGTLARVALELAGARLATTGMIPMARTADVRRRIEFLRKKLYAMPISRKWLAAAALLGLLTVTGVSGFKVVVAEPAPQKQQAADQGSKTPEKENAGNPQASPEQRLEQQKALINRRIESRKAVQEAVSATSDSAARANPSEWVVTLRTGEEQRWRDLSLRLIRLNDAPTTQPETRGVEFVVDNGSAVENRGMQVKTTEYLGSYRVTVDEVKPDPAKRGEGTATFRINLDTPAAGAQPGNNLWNAKQPGMEYVFKLKRGEQKRWLGLSIQLARVNKTGERQSVEFITDNGIQYDKRNMDAHATEYMDDYRVTVEEVNVLPGGAGDGSARFRITYIPQSLRGGQGKAGNTTAAQAVIVRTYKINEKDGPRIKALINSILEVDGETLNPAERRVIINKGELIVRDTPENVKKVEELLIDKKFVEEQKEEKLDIKNFSLVPRDTGAITDQARAFANRCVEAVKVFLYHDGGESKAASAGRRLWFDPATLQLTVVDTPASLARVGQYLESLPELRTAVRQEVIFLKYQKAGEVVAALKKIIVFDSLPEGTTFTLSTLPEGPGNPNAVIIRHSMQDIYKKTMDLIAELDKPGIKLEDYVNRLVARNQTIRPAIGGPSLRPGQDVIFLRYAVAGEAVVEIMNRIAPPGEAHEVTHKLRAAGTGRRLGPGGRADVGELHLTVQQIVPGAAGNATVQCSYWVGRNNGRVLQRTSFVEFTRGETRQLGGHAVTFTETDRDAENANETRACFKIGYTTAAPKDPDEIRRLPGVGVDNCGQMNAIVVNYHSAAELAAVREVVKAIDHVTQQISIETQFIQITTATTAGAPFSPQADLGARELDAKSGEIPKDQKQEPELKPTKLWTLGSLSVQEQGKLVAMRREGRIKIVNGPRVIAMDGLDAQFRIEMVEAPLAPNKPQFSDAIHGTPPAPNEAMMTLESDKLAVVVSVTPSWDKKAKKIDLKDFSVELFDNGKRSGRQFEVGLKNGQSVLIMAPEFKGYAILLTAMLVE